MKGAMITSHEFKITILTIKKTDEGKVLSYSKSTTTLL